MSGLRGATEQGSGQYVCRATIGHISICIAAAAASYTYHLNAHYLSENLPPINEFSPPEESVNHCH